MPGRFAAFRTAINADSNLAAIRSTLTFARASWISSRSFFIDQPGIRVFAFSAHQEVDVNFVEKDRRSDGNR
jgi:hypothetical protein